MERSMYRFPMFFDLNGQKAVIVGGGNIALHRAKILLDFGAKVTVVAPSCEALPEGAELVKRPYRTGDLDGAFLAVAATDQREVNRKVGQDAKNAGIFVSVADCKEECTFFFPAICMGSGLVSGVVSTGEDHRKTARAAKAIRAVLEDIT